MVMMAPVVVRALESLQTPGIKILLSPSGERFTKKISTELAGSDLTLICGRYAGIDHRVTNYVDRIIAVGDVIVSGGELPALMAAEAVVRLIPGVLGDSQSLEEDMGYPVYTRPREFRGMRVPEVLVSGDHGKIRDYRDREAKYGKDNRRTNK